MPSILPVNWAPHRSFSLDSMDRSASLEADRWFSRRFANRFLDAAAPTGEGVRGSVRDTAQHRIGCEHACEDECMPENVRRRGGMEV